MPRAILPQIMICLISICWFSNANAQALNQENIEQMVKSGELSEAEKRLKNFWESDHPLTISDSIFITKHLGVIYSSKKETREKGREFFRQLLLLKPSAGLHDTYASMATIELFQKTRENLREEIGGSILIPHVAVFDFRGDMLDEGESRSLTRQFTDELKEVRIFRTLDYQDLQKRLEQQSLDPSECGKVECYNEIGTKLLVDKVVVVEFDHIENLYTLSLKFIDIPSGKVLHTIKRAVEDKFKELVLNHLPELATELRNQEAAWLNLAISPQNAVLKLDGDEIRFMANKLPVNPGKHEICAQASGYISKCKSFSVRKGDLITYTLSLNKEAEETETGTQAFPGLQKATGSPDQAQSDEEQPIPGKVLWWIIGGMAIISVSLAVIFNT